MYLRVWRILAKLGQLGRTEGPASYRHVRLSPAKQGKRTTNDHDRAIDERARHSRSSGVRLRRSSIDDEQLNCHLVGGKQLNCHLVGGKQLNRHFVDSSRLNCHYVVSRQPNCRFNRRVVEDAAAAATSSK